MTQAGSYDVVVVGAGNAALCAALAAREHNVSVLVVERAPRHARGGNSWFTGGLVRYPYNGLADLRELIPEMTDAEAANVDVGAYSEDEFFEDVARVTEYQADADLVGIMVSRAFDTMRWMRRDQGVRFGLAMGRQAFQSNGRFRFWGSAPTEFMGGGIGLVDRLFESAEARGVEIRYETRAQRLLVGNDGEINGVVVRSRGREAVVQARAVVLAAGGFEANPEMRAKYLGPDWDAVKVRGTEYNTGDGLRMALTVGAQAYGHWSGCHAVAWDLNAPPTGNRRIGESYQKHSYPFGVVVNRRGERFLDEGADFRNYTYAKYGREIMKQPGMAAFQIFDAKVMHLLRAEYRIAQVTKAQATTLDELARQLGIDPGAFGHTIQRFNSAVTNGPFEPTIKDGKRTRGIDPPKSNWALPIDVPPFTGFAVTCGITFTFGGVRVNERAEVLDGDGWAIRGLSAAGEMVGGLFYHNYPGGSGLTSGAVFGRLAGAAAAESALARRTELPVCV